MKILFFGDFNSNSTNISQAESFERAGCEVVRYDFRHPDSKAEGDVRDHEMVAYKQTEDPDIILFSKCNEVPNWVVEECRGPVRVLWYMDPYNFSYTDQLVGKMDMCELVFCNIWEAHEQTLVRGIHSELLQEGFDATVDKPMDEKEEFDVVFIGYFRGPQRTQYHDRFRFRIVQGAYREEHARMVCRSRINLNFTEGGSSDRTYKVMAAGGFLLTQSWPHMEDDFTPGKDFEVFESPEEFEEKVEFYLLNEGPRRRIAIQGYQTVQKFTRDRWAQRILDMAVDNRLGKVGWEELEGKTKSKNQGSGWSVIYEARCRGQNVVLKWQKKEPERGRREKRILAKQLPGTVKCLGCVDDGIVLEKLFPLPLKVTEEQAQGYVTSLMQISRGIYLAGDCWVAIPKHVGLDRDGKLKVFDFNDDERKYSFFYEHELVRVSVRPLISELCSGWGYDAKRMIQKAFDTLVENEYLELRNVHQPICFEEYQHFKRMHVETGRIEPANRECNDRWEILLKALGRGEGRTSLDIGSDVGWFTFHMAELGFESYGVEYDKQKVEFCLMLTEWFERLAVFHQGSVDLEYAQRMPEYDVVLALSVLHWLLYDSPEGSGQYSLGMGKEMFLEFLSVICKKVRDAFVLEIPIHAYSKFGVKDGDELKRLLEKVGGFERVEELGMSDAKRPLFGCFKQQGVRR